MLNLERYETVGIASSEEKLKLGAIFFDKIYSIVNNEFEIPKEYQYGPIFNFDEFRIVNKKIKHIYNENILEASALEFNRKLSDKTAELSKEDIIKFIEEIQDFTINKTYNLLSIEMAAKISNGRVIGIPLFNKTILNDHLEKDYLNNHIQEKIEIKIIDAPIIDASLLDWKQIIQAKKDPEFINKVKRFSLFINKNYKGKEMSFIIDDLSLQIEDYKFACSKHGISLKQETIKSLASSKSLFGTLGAALFSVLANMPQYALVAGTVGIGLEIMNLHITVKQYEDKFESFVRESPISLLFDKNIR